MMSIALSRSGAFAERPDWKRKGSISGQEPSGSSMIIAAISPVVSAIFLRTMCIWVVRCVSVCCHISRVWNTTQRRVIIFYVSAAFL